MVFLNLLKSLRAHEDRDKRVEKYPKTLVAQMQVLEGTGRETNCIQCNNVPLGKAY